MLRFTIVLAFSILAVSTADACNIQSSGPDGCNAAYQKRDQIWHQQELDRIRRAQEIENARREALIERERRDREARDKIARERYRPSPTYPAPQPPPPQRTTTTTPSPQGGDECRMFPHMCAALR
jgi:hypothetical protein